MVQSLLGGGDDWALGQIRLAALLQQHHDEEVAKAANTDAQRSRASSGFVVRHSHEVGANCRDNGTRAEGHDQAHRLRLRQIAKAPDEQGTDDQSGLRESAKDRCFKHGFLST
ncbi:unannotated protein [freshwater metagenome]|uniref:Unannotated protein n=1 Tax=freshwater metagenome TaxID=449393 RepID=A0A6J7GQX5_9ZZZZ